MPKHYGEGDFEYSSTGIIIISMLPRDVLLKEGAYQVFHPLCHMTVACIPGLEHRLLSNEIHIVCVCPYSSSTSRNGSN